jgi:molecular chaperone GrpE (heat shock protein)
MADELSKILNKNNSEDNVVVITIESDGQIDPSQYATLCKRINWQLNVLDAWIEETNKKNKTEAVGKLMKLSDSFQAVREIREASTRVRRYTQFVKDVKMSKDTLDSLLATLNTE